MSLQFQVFPLPPGSTHTSRPLISSFTAQKGLSLFCCSSAVDNTTIMRSRLALNDCPQSRFSFFFSLSLSSVPRASLNERIPKEPVHALSAIKQAAEKTTAARASGDTLVPRAAGRPHAPTPLYFSLGANRRGLGTVISCLSFLFAIYFFSFSSSHRDDALPVLPFRDEITLPKKKHTKKNLRNILEEQASSPTRTSL